MRARGAAYADDSPRGRLLLRDARAASPRRAAGTARARAPGVGGVPSSGGGAGSAARSGAVEGSSRHRSAVARRARAARGRGRAAQRADERAVVLVVDLAGAVVELELLQRGERAVALLDQREPPLLGGRRRVEAVVAPRRARAGTAARRAPPPRPRAATPRTSARVTRARARGASTSRRCSRASGQSATSGAEQEDDPGDPDQVDERLHEHLAVDDVRLRVARRRRSRTGPRRAASRSDRRPRATARAG